MRGSSLTVSKGQAEGKNLSRHNRHMTSQSSIKLTKSSVVGVTDRSSKHHSMHELSAENQSHFYQASQEMFSKDLLIKKQAATI